MTRTAGTGRRDHESASRTGQSDCSSGSRPGPESEAAQGERPPSGPGTPGSAGVVRRIRGEPMSTTTRTTTTVSTRRDPVEDALTTVLALIGWAVIAVFVAARWALLFPMVSLPIAAAAALFWFYGWLPALGMSLASVAALALWRLRFRESFSRWVTRRARARFLRWWRYQRQWSALLDDCGLCVRDDLGRSQRTPRILGVEIGQATDTVRTAMVPGQCPEDWINRASHLAHAFGASGMPRPNHWPGSRGTGVPAR